MRSVAEAGPDQRRARDRGRQGLPRLRRNAVDREPGGLYRAHDRRPGCVEVEVARARERGWAEAAGECEEDLNAVAAPALSARWSRSSACRVPRCGSIRGPGDAERRRAPAGAGRADLGDPVGRAYRRPGLSAASAEPGGDGPARTRAAAPVPGSPPAAPQRRRRRRRTGTMPHRPGQDRVKCHIVPVLRGIHAENGDGWATRRVGPRGHHAPCAADPTGPVGPAPTARSPRRDHDDVTAGGA